MANVPNLPTAGLLTGGRQAETYATERQQDLANLSSTRIQNLKAVYDFQEYMDTRKFRDLEKRSRAADNQININTAPSRQASTEMTNQVATRQGQTTLNNEDLREQTQRKLLQQQKEKIDKDFTMYERESFMAAEAHIRELPPEQLDEQTYNTIYNDLVTKLAGRDGNVQAVARRLQQNYGLTPKASPQNFNIMQNIGRLAGHDAATWRAEHLAKSKAFLEARYGSGAKKAVEYNTDIMKATEDLFNARDEYSQRLALGDTNGAQVMKQRITDLENRIDGIISTNHYDLLEKEQKQVLNDIQFLDGFPGDVEDANPNLVPKYNELLGVIANTFPNYSSDPVFLRNMFRRMYKYDPSSWYFGSRGNIVKKSAEEIVESMTAAANEQQFIVDALTSATTLSNMDDKQKDTARRDITYNIKETHAGKVRNSRGQ